MGTAPVGLSSGAGFRIGVVCAGLALGWLAAPPEPPILAEGSVPAGVELLRLLGLALVEADR